MTALLREICLIIRALTQALPKSRIQNWNFFIKGRLVPLYLHTDADGIQDRS